jgi:hypothetical protein
MKRMKIFFAANYVQRGKTQLNNTGNNCTTAAGRTLARYVFSAIPMKFGDRDNGRGMSIVG